MRYTLFGCEARSHLIHNGCFLTCWADYSLLVDSLFGLLLERLQLAIPSQ